MQREEFCLIKFYSEVYYLDTWTQLCSPWPLFFFQLGLNLWLKTKYRHIHKLASLSLTVLSFPQASNIITELHCSANDSRASQTCKYFTRVSGVGAESPKEKQIWQLLRLNNGDWIWTNFMFEQFLEMNIIYINSFSGGNKIIWGQRGHTFQMSNMLKL